MITKKAVVQAISDFPDEFTIDFLVERLVLLAKVERGELDSIEGNVLSEDQLQYEMKKWFK